MLTALLLSALISPQEAPQLLPQAPAGWSFERLDFPLDFAPDIALEGFEELRFAPGMFDPASPTYFSYVLAVRAEGRVAMDRAFLEDFLARYYRGLMVAVAGSRGLDADAADTRVELAAGAHGYVATVETIDAFSSGAPLRIRLELSVHPGPDATELLGLASPMDVDGPAWRSLRELGRDWRATRTPQAYLNHLYLVVDEDTYAALAAEPFLRDAFGVFEERTTVRTDISYTGQYHYGRHTYFEFLKPDPQAGFAPGSSGVAFGFEAPGGTQLMSARLSERGVNSFAGPRTRALGEQQVPWFEIMGIEQPSASARLSLFTLEYEPSFLERWHPEAGGETSGIGRAQVLERYAAALGQLERRGESPFGDVVEVRLELQAAERARFLETCRAFGHSVDEGAQTTVVHGPGVDYVLTESEGPGAVTGFVTSLRRPLEARTWKLGRLQVELGERGAVFSRVP